MRIGEKSQVQQLRAAEGLQKDNSNSMPKNTTALPYANRGRLKGWGSFRVGGQGPSAGHLMSKE